ncbi:MAG: hypothetical protein IKP59_03690 [Prevotella sp.]|nr:hypothetical protein [Prevotella sp.]
MKKINLAKQMLLSTLLVFLCASNVQAYDKLTTTGGTYQLITTANVDKLKDGDIVIYASRMQDAGNDWYLTIMGEPDAKNNMFNYYQTSKQLANDENISMPDEITLGTVNTPGNPYEYIFKKSGETFALLNNYGDDFYVHGLAEDGAGNYPLTASEEPCYWSFATIEAKYIKTQMSGYRVLKAQTTFTNATYKYKFDTHTNGYIALCYKKVSPTSPFSITFNETGYATMYYENNDVELADGMKAFTLSLVDDEGVYKLRFNDIGTTVPHNTAVMIKGTPNTEYHPLLYSTAATTANNLTPLNDDNALYGTETEAMQSKGEGRYYKLANDETKQGMRFYWGAANGAAFTNSAHKAYLFIPASSPASITSEFLFADDATAVGSISENNNTNKAKKIYDITGRAQGNSHSNAINIVNNKKFIK